MIATKVKRGIRELAGSLADFVAPRYCEVCKDYLEPNENRYDFICDRCYNALPLAPEPEAVFNKLVEFFDKDDLALSGACALFSIKEEHSYMDLIYALKYYGIKRIGVKLGENLGRALESYGKTDFDAVIPVPIHPARRRERGFNQALEIAKGAAEVLSAPVENNIIIRRKYSKSQTTLTVDERRKNVARVFALGKGGEKLDGGKFLLVDDVLTTGSTLNACATVLMTGGAEEAGAAALVNA